MQFVKYARIWRHLQKYKGQQITRVTANCSHYTIYCNLVMLGCVIFGWGSQSSVFNPRYSQEEADFLLCSCLHLDVVRHYVWPSSLKHTLIYATTLLVSKVLPTANFQWLFPQHNHCNTALHIVGHCSRLEPFNPQRSCSSTGRPWECGQFQAT